MESGGSKAGSLKIEDLVSTKDIKRRWGIEPTTVRQWKHLRKIWPVARRRGRVLLFLAADVERQFQADPFYDTWARERLRG